MLAVWGSIVTWTRHSLPAHDQPVALSTTTSTRALGPREHPGDLWAQRCRA